MISIQLIICRQNVADADSHDPADNSIPDIAQVQKFIWPSGV